MLGLDGYKTLFAKTREGDAFDVEGVDTGYEHTTLEHRALAAVTRLAQEHSDNQAARNAATKAVIQGLTKLYIFINKPLQSTGLIKY